jgi:hypothetical protein
MKRSSAEAIRGLRVSPRIKGVRVGTIVKVDEKGQVLVDFPGNMSGAIPARVTGRMKPGSREHFDLSGQQVLIVFENDDPELPIVFDSLHSKISEVADSPSVVLDVEKPEDVTIDGRRVTFDATEEIVLRCGKASITLTRAGKVLIRGGYLLSRSSGVNTIKGASTQIN